MSLCFIRRRTASALLLGLFTGSASAYIGVQAYGYFNTQKEAEEIYARAKKAISDNLHNSYSAEFADLRVVARESRYYVCGSVTAKSRVDRDVPRRWFIYSMFDGELLMQPESVSEDSGQLVQLTKFMKLSNLVRCH